MDRLAELLEFANPDLCLRIGRQFEEVPGKPGLSRALGPDQLQRVARAFRKEGEKTQTLRLYFRDYAVAQECWGILQRFPNAAAQVYLNNKLKKPLAEGLHLLPSSQSQQQQVRSRWQQLKPQGAQRGRLVNQQQQQHAGGSNAQRASPAASPLVALGRPSAPGLLPLGEDRQLTPVRGTPPLLAAPHPSLGQLEAGIPALHLQAPGGAPAGMKLRGTVAAGTQLEPSTHAAAAAAAAAGGGGWSAGRRSRHPPQQQWHPPAASTPTNLGRSPGYLAPAQTPPVSCAQREPVHASFSPLPLGTGGSWQGHLAGPQPQRHPGAAGPASSLPHPWQAQVETSAAMARRDAGGGPLQQQLQQHMYRSPGPRQMPGAAPGPECHGLWPSSQGPGLHSPHEAPAGGFSVTTPPAAVTQAHLAQQPNGLGPGGEDLGMPEVRALAAGWGANFRRQRCGGRRGISQGAASAEELLAPLPRAGNDAGGEQQQGLGAMAAAASGALGRLQAPQLHRSLQATGASASAGQKPAAGAALQRLASFCPEQQQQSMQVDVQQQQQQQQGPALSPPRGGETRAASPQKHLQQQPQARGQQLQQLQGAGAPSQQQDNEPAQREPVPTLEQQLLVPAPAGPVTQPPAAGQATSAEAQQRQQPQRVVDMYQPQRTQYCAPMLPAGWTFRLLEHTKQEVGGGACAKVDRIQSVWTPDGSGRQPGLKLPSWVVRKVFKAGSRFEQGLLVMQSTGFAKVLIQRLEDVVNVIAAEACYVDDPSCSVAGYYYLMEDQGPDVRELHKFSRSLELVGLKEGDDGSAFVDANIFFCFGRARTFKQLQWRKQGLPWGAVALVWHKLLRLVGSLVTQCAAHTDLKGANLLLLNPAALAAVVQHFLEAIQQVEAAEGYKFQRDDARGRAFAFDGIWEKAMREVKIVICDKDSVRIWCPFTGKWLDCGFNIFGSLFYIASEVRAATTTEAKVDAASTEKAMLFSMGRIIVAMAVLAKGDIPLELLSMVLAPGATEPNLKRFLKAMGMPALLLEDVCWVQKEDPNDRPTFAQMKELNFWQPDCLSKMAFKMRMPDAGVEATDQDYIKLVQPYVCSRLAAAKDRTEFGAEPPALPAAAASRPVASWLSLPELAAPSASRLHMVDAAAAAANGAAPAASQPLLVTAAAASSAAAASQPPLVTAAAAASGAAAANQPPLVTAAAASSGATTTTSQLPLVTAAAAAASSAAAAAGQPPVSIVAPAPDQEPVVSGLGRKRPGGELEAANKRGRAAEGGGAVGD